MRELNSGYSVEVDTADEQTWYQFLREFDDANIFQTWAYGKVTCGRRNMSHLILRKNGKVAAIAQARIVKMPFVNVGVAYVRWGPVWESRGTGQDVERFRQALRALRNEYACKRGLVLRLFPNLYENGSPLLLEILAEEGYSSSRNDVRSRTILMELSPPLENLRRGMRKQWRHSLTAAERTPLEVVEGSEDHLFELFLDIYQEMVSRKRFAPGVDADQFKMMQSQLPDDFKMKVLLCKSEDGLCAGLICSAIGRTAIYLLGATSNVNKRSNGSYLLQWKLIEELKSSGISIYNLHGINPEKNQGTYIFKSGLSGKNGREVFSLGRFDTHASFPGNSCVELGDRLRMSYRKARQLLRTSLSSKPWFKPAQ